MRFLVHIDPGRIGVFTGHVLAHFHGFAGGVVGDLHVIQTRSHKVPGFCYESFHGLPV